MTTASTPPRTRKSTAASKPGSSKPKSRPTTTPKARSRSASADAALAPAPEVETAPPVQTAPALPPVAPPPLHKTKAWPRRHPVLTGVIAVGAIAVAAAAGSSGGGTKPSTHASTVSNSTVSTPPAQSAPKHAVAAAPKHTVAAAPKHTVAPAPKRTAPAAPTYTAAEQNAIQAAQGYLSMGSGFSRAGLIQQLSSKYGSGFTKADATFAVDHLKVDWNQQAVLAAKGYLSMGSGFSRAGLVQQLSSPYGSQFTLAQATYAADHVGL